MFGFSKTNSPRFINEMLCQLVGEEAAADFWQDFKDNYITRADIDFIASTGRQHYPPAVPLQALHRRRLHGTPSGSQRLRTHRQCCHLVPRQRPLPHPRHARRSADRPVTISTTATHSPGSWKAPRAQKLFCDIWEQIATALRERAVILGYELINEPIALLRRRDTQRQARAAARKRAVEALSAATTTTTSYSLAARSGTATSQISPTGATTTKSCTPATATAANPQQMPYITS